MSISDKRMRQLQDGLVEPQTVEEYAFLDWMRSEQEREQHEHEMRELERWQIEEHFAKHPHG